jgi:hypothetical protein
VKWFLEVIALLSVDALYSYQHSSHSCSKTACGPNRPLPKFINNSLTTTSVPPGTLTYGTEVTYSCKCGQGILQDRYGNPSPTLSSSTRCMGSVGWSQSEDSFYCTSPACKTNHSSKQALTLVIINTESSTILRIWHVIYNLLMLPEIAV